MFHVKHSPGPVPSQSADELTGPICQVRMFHVKQPRKLPVKLDPASGDGKYVSVNPNHLAI